MGYAQRSDREQLAHAAAEGRCLVTRNIGDFVHLAREAIARQQPHAGIVLCPATLRGFEIRTIADRLLWVARRFPRGLGGYDVLFL